MKNGDTAHKPTKEQWFWEQCGLRLICPPERDQYHKGIWETPEGMRIDTPDLSSIRALGYLSKYAVPIVREKLGPDELTKRLQGWISDVIQCGINEADSLFDLLYIALGGKE